MESYERIIRYKKYLCEKALFNESKIPTLATVWVPRFRVALCNEKTRNLR